MDNVRVRTVPMHIGEGMDVYCLTNWINNTYCSLFKKSIAGNYKFLALLGALTIQLWHLRTDLVQAESPQSLGGLQKQPSSGECDPACLPCWRQLRGWVKGQRSARAEKQGPVIQEAAEQTHVCCPTQCERPPLCRWATSTWNFPLQEPL